MRDMGVEVGEGWTYIADDFVGFVVDGDGLAEDCRAQHVCSAGTIPDIMVFFCCNKPCLPDGWNRECLFDVLEDLEARA